MMKTVTAGTASNGGAGSGDGSSGMNGSSGQLGDVESFATLQMRLQYAEAQAEEAQVRK